VFLKPFWIDREVHARNDRNLVRLLKYAHLKYGQAAIEEIDGRAGRGIDRARGDVPGLGRLGQCRPKRPGHRPNWRRQVVTNLEEGSPEMSSPSFDGRLTFVSISTQHIQKEELLSPEVPLSVRTQ
jgi:hypothetical protein